MKQKGFTLVELLAIIIIAGTISIVSFVSITNTIKKNQIRENEVFENSILGATKLYIAANLESYDSLETIGAKEEITTQKLIDNGYLKKNITNPTAIALLDYYVIVIKNPDGFLDYILANTGEEPVLPEYRYTESVLNGSDPVLESGMIPIYYDGNTAKVASLTSEWYNYSNKIWANSVLINSDRRGYYQNAPKGTEIIEADVIGYFVWIPRFKFKIFTNTVSSDEQVIDILFESKTEKTTNTTVGQYLTHPAFTYGTNEVAGLWFGKFDSTGTQSNLTVKPNSDPLTNINLATAYKIATDLTGSRSGIKSTIRVTKFSEWSATSYLATSNFGIGKKIAPNNFFSSYTLKTGCGSLSGATTTSSTCHDEYGTASEYKQSSTGNITGIFDMSAGAWENNMSFILNSSNEVLTGNDSSSYSGFNGKLTNGSSINSGIALPDEKNYDKIEAGTITTLCNTKKYLGYIFCGNTAWYESSHDINTDGPILETSGGVNIIANSSQFTYWGWVANEDNEDGFRTVFVIE